MPDTYLWHLWPGRHWPASVADESALRADLEAEAQEPATVFERGDMTAVLNMLRLGITLSEVRVYAPGLDAPRLLAAYQTLATARGEAHDCFIALLSDPTPAEVAHKAGVAARILPVPTYRLVSAVRSHEEGTITLPELELVVEAVEEAVADAGTSAQATEERLIELTPDPFTTHPDVLDPEAEARTSLAVRLGRQLYDPYDGCLWGSPLYLPRRVTDLLPSRVTDLLQEAES